MKRLLLICAFALPLGAVVPDESVPAGFHQWNAESFAELHKAMVPKAAADAHHVAVQKIADYPNDSLSEVYRVGDGSPELHETEVDVFFVQSGSGVLVVGGTLTGSATARFPAASIASSPRAMSSASQRKLPIRSFSTGPKKSPTSSSRQKGISPGYCVGSVS
jgi:hypothetical protein